MVYIDIIIPLLSRVSLCLSVTTLPQTTVPQCCHLRARCSSLLCTGLTVNTSSSRQTVGELYLQLTGWTGGERGEIISVRIAVSPQADSESQLGKAHARPG